MPIKSATIEKGKFLLKEKETDESADVIGRNQEYWHKGNTIPEHHTVKLKDEIKSSQIFYTRWDRIERGPGNLSKTKKIPHAK